MRRQKKAEGDKGARGTRGPHEVGIRGKGDLNSFEFGVLSFKLNEYFLLKT